MMCTQRTLLETARKGRLGFYKCRELNKIERRDSRKVPRHDIGCDHLERSWAIKKHEASEMHDILDCLVRFCGRGPWG